MNGNATECIIARKQYPHGLTVSPHRLVSNWRETEKGSFAMERSGRRGLNQITRAGMIEHGTTGKMCSLR